MVYINVNDDVPLSGHCGIVPSSPTKLSQSCSGMNSICKLFGSISIISYTLFLTEQKTTTIDFTLIFIVGIGSDTDNKIKFKVFALSGLLNVLRKPGSTL